MRKKQERASDIFFDVHCYGLKLRPELAERGPSLFPVSIWNYIPGARVPMLDMLPTPGEPSVQAARFFDGLCKFEAGDAILGPDGSLSVMVRPGEGAARSEEWGLSAARPRRLRWWAVKSLDMDMVELWSPASEIRQWLCTYYRERG